MEFSILSLKSGLCFSMDRQMTFKKWDNEFKLLRWLFGIIFLAILRSTQLKPNFMPFHTGSHCFQCPSLGVIFVPFMRITYVSDELIYASITFYTIMCQQHKIIPLFKNCEVEYPNMIFYFKIWSKNVINKITAFWDFFKNYDIPAFVRFRPLTNR